MQIKKQPDSPTYSSKKRKSDKSLKPEEEHAAAPGSNVVSGHKPRGRTGGRPRKRSSSTELCALQSACREPRGKGINWVCCDKCEEWYHLQCVGITAKQAETEDFICQLCVPSVQDPNSGGDSSNSSTMANHSVLQALPRTRDNLQNFGPPSASSSTKNNNSKSADACPPSQTQSSSHVSSESPSPFTELSSASSPRLREQPAPTNTSVVATSTASPTTCGTSRCNTGSTPNNLEMISEDVRAGAESLHALASRSATVS